MRKPSFAERKNERPERLTETNRSWHADLQAAVEKLPVDQRAAVEAELGRYVGANAEGTARVRLAVLRLSKGDLGLVRHYIDVAIKDFRDVLWWGEGGG